MALNPKSLATGPQLPPPSERIPVLRWIKKNLCSTWYNVVLTVVTLAVIVLVGTGLLRWAVSGARWEVIPANVKGLLVGTYTRDQLLRVWATLYMVVALFGLSGGLHRGLMKTVARAVFVVSLALVLVAFALDWLPLNLSAFALDPPNRLWVAGIAGFVLLGYGLASAFRSLHASKRLEMALWLLSLPLMFVFLIGVGPISLGVGDKGQILLNLALLLAGLSSTVHSARGRQGVLWALVLAWGTSWALGGVFPPLGPLRGGVQGAALSFLVGAGVGYIGKNSLSARWEKALWLGLIPLVGVALFSGLFEGVWDGAFGFPGVVSLFPLRPGGWDKWGFLVNVFGALFGITLSLPFGILLALGRQSKLPAIRLVCTGYIELIRGVPLISLLFMASNMLPLLLPGGVHPDIVIRAMVTITAFSAAYMAENVRGGLQAIATGQYEAAYALGLNGVLTTVLIVLPQALRNVIPAIVGQFISLFKDTTLFSYISIIELVAAARSVYGNLEWRGAIFELYIFIGLVFWLFCYSMSYVSRRIEKSLGVGER